MLLTHGFKWEPPPTEVVDVRTKQPQRKKELRAPAGCGKGTRRTRRHHHIGRSEKELGLHQRTKSSAFPIVVFGFLGVSQFLL